MKKGTMQKGARLASLVKLHGREDKDLVKKKLHKVVNLQEPSKLHLGQHLKLHLSLHQVLDLSLHTNLLVTIHLNLHQPLGLHQVVNLQLHIGPTGSLPPHNQASIPLERHVIPYHHHPNQQVPLGALLV
ncbi:bromodomain-containing protein DDB_G0271118-like [Quercus lobata]|uniref:bromodomain-containing protein DDB_G0271118-like n=1 Tax=Quercus lobata TaxID=97700 RepID=UPI001247BF9A|nr:bromodomain-containing protein DDB_G0271118-like [Quercus lobata]